MGVYFSGRNYHQNRRNHAKEYEEGKGVRLWIFVRLETTPWREVQPLPSFATFSETMVLT
jgi:hypothetical protein